MTDKHTKPSTIYKYIAVEGNIGAGKTTLCKLLSDDFDCRLVLESFADNPFLSLFYKTSERFALPVELFFMTERIEQMQSAIAASKKDGKPIVADYFFEKTALFAENNLKGDEFALFKRLYQLSAAAIRSPDLIIYLHLAPRELLMNIKKRGREYEANISEDYLKKIEKKYFDYLQAEKKIPVLVLHLKDKYDEHADTVYQTVKSVLSEKYAAGIRDIIF
jgi:deoxyguanosine kinase